MKAIYLDCFSGISGNMLLGAFIQAGVPLEHLQGELKKLPMGDEFVVQSQTVQKLGITAEYVTVELSPEYEAEQGHCHEQAEPGHEHAAEHDHQHSHAECHHHDNDHEHTHDHEHEHNHDYEHTHDHNHHDHQHSHDHGHSEPQGHVHRSMADIRKIINDSTLSPRVKADSLKIFTVLAEAEGKVHGRPADEVHFHEVGALDSIADIVGAAICLEYLGIDKILVSPLNVGGGTVKCAHGIMPVPAPATAQLLLDLPFYGHGDKELTTPTGAAFVKALGQVVPSRPLSFHGRAVGYGAGYWDLPVANVLRLWVGELAEPVEDIFLLEANIDDMNPQIYGYLYDRLLQEAGALDVWTTPIHMKKNRPANMLAVLVNAAQREQCLQLIMAETTTIGIRVQKIQERITAQRQIVDVETKYGTARAKISSFRGHITNISPEYDDCCRLAAAKGIPLKQIQAEVLQQARNK